jgi:hypothetical protein
MNMGLSQLHGDISTPNCGAVTQVAKHHRFIFNSTVAKNSVAISLHSGTSKSWGLDNQKCVANLVSDIHPNVFSVKYAHRVREEAFQSTI